jgi:hypothetical protein
LSETFINMPQSIISKMIKNTILAGVLTLILLGLVVVIFYLLPAAAASISPKVQKPQRAIEKVDVFGKPCNEYCLIGNGELCAVGDTCNGNLKVRKNFIVAMNYCS